MDEQKPAHINAFYGAVDLAKAELEQAKGKLESAERDLKAHPDYEKPKKESPKSDEPEESEEEPKTSKPKK